jgi:O-Antigen ligase
MAADRFAARLVPHAVEGRIARGPVILALLFLAAVLAGALVAVTDLTVLALGGAVVALGLVALVSAFSPRVAVGLVFTASMLGGLTLQTPVGVLRMDQAIVLPALCGVLARWAFDRSRPQLAGGGASRFLAVCLGLYVLANLVSTLLLAIDVASSLRVVLWLALSFAAYVLTIAVVGRYCSVGTLLDDVVAIGTAASVAALALSGLAGVGVSYFGVQADPVVGQLSAKGTFLEANLLGSFAAMTAILAASLLVHAPRHSTRRRALLFACVGICSTATYLSFTRAAWLGLAVGGLVVLLLSRPPSGRARVIVRGGFLLALAASLLLVSGLGVPLLDRLASLFTDSTGTIAYRSANYAQALSGIPQHLWIGLGTNSFGQHFLDPTQNDSRAYLAGLFIATLWDVGLLGLAFLLVAFTTLARTLWQALASVDDTVRSQTVGLSAAFVCALVAYQSTNGFWFAYNWILIGLAASIPVIITARRGWSAPETWKLSSVAPGRERVVR